MEFLLGGVAACGAGFFTNPLEVVKTRMQLQGELKARGLYAIHYRNVFHASYTIAKHDGILALQKGLAPALWYQFLMNGLRLGAFQWFTNLGFTKDKNGNNSFPRSVIAGACSGVVGAVCGSPIYMVKTQLQSRSAQAIAVGHQFEVTGMYTGLRNVYTQYGIKGLYRGVSGAIPRVMVGSAAQLSTFSTSINYVKNAKIFHEESWLIPLMAGMLSGIVTVCFMTPFDVISTRLYNQPTDANGRGTLYRNVVDCMIKICRKEGLWGLYKGWGPSLFRLGPHSVLSLLFWNRTRKYYYDYINNKKKSIS